MQRLLRRTVTLIVASMLLWQCLQSNATTENWPTIDEFVQRMDTIVYAEQVGDFETQSVDKIYDLRIVEVWKGEVNRERFACMCLSNAMKLPGRHGLVMIEPGQRVVVCFAPSGLRDGKFVEHATAFAMHDGKIIYAQTSDSEANRRSEMTIEEFKARVITAAAKLEPSTGRQGKT